MKTFVEVEDNRRAYHRWPDRNSVHRASAIFPILDRRRYTNNLTFLNHWLVKRGIPEIGARHTIRDEDGSRLGQVYGVLDRPKAYSVDLDEVAEACGIERDFRSGSWEVEFFSARNLFIPYPAVVHTVSNESFCNQVHAYARMLNDQEEANAVGAIKVREASIDTIVDDNTDTFVTVINGPRTADSSLIFRLVDQDAREQERTLPYTAPPYGTCTYFLSEIFGPECGPIELDQTLFVSQPYMPMFYNRLFAGVVERGGAGALSANHSYYDNSAREEFFSAEEAFDRQANMTLPLIDTLSLRVRLYPIISPADLDFHVRYYDSAGRGLKTLHDVAHWRSGQSAILDLDISALADGMEASAADLYVTVPPGWQVPTRLTLQVCYGRPGHLWSSVNLSMHSPYVFVPEGKTGLNWMLVVGDTEIENRIAVCHSSPVLDDSPHDVQLILHRDEDDETLGATLSLIGHSGFSGELAEVIPDYRNFLNGRNGFIYLQSESPFLRSLSIQSHRVTGHSSGEHSF